ncbi:MAG TPA: hypothetical protein VEQ10_22110 [Vicinamibacteria bacterium]|nr:hypothetical protein [Vicinamibacteria bacterium]
MVDGLAPRRSAAGRGALPGQDGWLALSDDELLFQIQSLPDDHDDDEELLRVVRSSRHFFLRQEAAKRMHDHTRLKDFADDRHIGQILARHMERDADVDYLERLARETRHLEVRNAARAELMSLLKAKGRRRRR